MSDNNDTPNGELPNRDKLDELDGSSVESTVVIDDGEEKTIYTEGSECAYCGMEASGVVVMEVVNTKIHRPVCEDDFVSIEETGQDIEFRGF